MTTTNILVLAGDKPIGAIQSISVKENTSDNKLEILRMRLSRSRLSETFEGGHFHVTAQKYPVHIVVLDDGIETMRATNVWILGIDKTFTTDEWIIAELVQAECESVQFTKIYKSSDE
jgi:hypothetical protein